MRNKDKKTTILCYRTMSDFIKIHQGADGGLLFLCYDDDGTTPKNCEVISFVGKLIAKGTEKVHTFDDSHFTKAGNTATLTLSKTETAVLAAGDYKLQLEKNEDEKTSIQISDYRIQVIGTY